MIIIKLSNQMNSRSNQ